MRVTLSRHAGFCDGVDRAYHIVKALAKDPKAQRPILVLGALVHNQDVVERITSWGVGQISRRYFLQAKKPKIGTLIITAHGVGPEIYTRAKKLGITLIDTTCPKVVKVQRLAKVFADRGYQVLVIGEKDHEEVKGVAEWGEGKTRIIESEKDLQKIPARCVKPMMILSQTTQNHKLVEKLTQAIQQKFPQAEQIPTICFSTEHRQKEAQKMAQKNDVMLIVGSPTSANSRRLAEVCQNLNRRSYFIQRAEDLSLKWLKNCQKIGVTAGASTPEWVIKAVLEKVKSVR